MSNASSNQSCVHDGAGYDEVFLSGQKDPNTSSEERNPSATFSSINEGLEMDRFEGDPSEGIDGVGPPIQSVIGPDGFREFIMLPIWMVNDFTSTIKEPHLKTLRKK